MTISQFLAHKSPGKSRLFALDSGETDHLVAVTALSSSDLDLTDDLVGELNEFLFARAPGPLEKVLERVPDAVRMAVRRFLNEQCPPMPERFSWYGPIENLRLSYFSRLDAELERHVASAYWLGLGLRLENQIEEDGRTGWEFELMTAQAFVPGSVEPRSWYLPTGVELVRTWTSRESTGGDPVRAALTVARAQAELGRWVRVHAVEHGAGDDPHESATTSELVVDIFDAPAPRAECDD
ncbi:hypothetical protein [Lentzea pudingi]|uniref:hypothetical protein n=1 Tax=Lentzea pudingi TaxID=1789439 RepID=UPI00166D6FD5|nr:hypothetical protein [Lentzea pudingi]